jgi:hypothetical protein
MRWTGPSFLVLAFLGATACGDQPLGRRADSCTPPAVHGTRHALMVDKDKAEEPAKKRKPKFTISKETTYVTGPRDEDGYIDYAAALNKRLSQGVTPDNNANVLLWKAFGPHPDGAKVPSEYFRLMGIQAPPERGDYYIDLARYIKEHLKIEPGKQADEIQDQLDWAGQRPWTPKQFPHIAAWLKANEKPLAVVFEATKRTHLFSPIVLTRTKKGSSGLIGAPVPGLLQCRDFARALTARAMLHVGQGRPNEAWQDLIACHRLGRVVARGATLIHALVGIAIDSVANGADQAFLDGAKLDTNRIKNCLRDLQKLPPMPPMADKVDLGERFMFLDSTIMIARGGIQTLEALAGGAGLKVPNAMAKRALDDVDWDPFLRTGNQWFDRLAATMRVKDGTLRRKELDQIDAEMKKLKAKLIASEALNKAFLGKDPKVKGKTLGDVIISLLIPAVTKIMQAGDRSKQIQNNLHLAFALAAYQREHGHYPKELDALAPKYLAKIPPDLFSGKPLIYRPSDNGYLLYSVGVNGQDDQGRSYDDDPPGDDLKVRMPLPKLPKK